MSTVLVQASSSSHTRSTLLEAPYKSPPSNKWVSCEKREGGGNVRKGKKRVTQCHNAVAQDGASPANCSTTLVSSTGHKYYFSLYRNRLLEEDAQFPILYDLPEHQPSRRKVVLQKYTSPTASHHNSIRHSYARRSRS